MLVSIVMSVYNSAQYLRECIDSVLCQSFKDFEFIIIDDFSNDKSVDIIKSYSDKRIKLIENSCNQGLTKNLNLGIRLSKGKYIARMDSDDKCHKDRLLRQVEYLNQNENIDICGTWGYIINEKGKIKLKSKLPICDKNIKNMLLCNNAIIHPSVMIRKSLFDSKVYDENFRTMQDYKLWADSFESKFYNIPEYLFFYRDNKNGISVTERKRKEERLKNLHQIYKELFESKNIVLEEDEVDLYVRSMQNLDYFIDKNESEQALKLIKKIIGECNDINKKRLLSNWARNNKILPKVKFMPSYLLGKVYGILELVNMLF